MDNNMDYTIVLTKQPSEFKVCACFMAATDPWIRLGMNEEQCLQAFEGDYRDVFVLKENQKIIGFIIIQTKGSFKGYIQTLCIEEKYRGKKWGTVLLGFAEKQILPYSPNIFICVSSFNEAALRLYQKFGFELIGPLKDFVKAGFTELLLRKSVGPILGYKTINNNYHLNS